MGQEREQFGPRGVIPSKLLFDGGISIRAKILYAMIDCMSNSRGYAFAKNDTLQRFLALNGENPSERTLQRALSELTATGRIVIENGTGGRETVRKIYIAEFYPKNPDMGDGVGTVNPDMGDGVTNNSIRNNKKKKSKKEKPQEAQCSEVILNYLDQWAVQWSDNPDDLQPLVKNLHTFFDFRKAKQKPILTFGQADFFLNRLASRSREEPYRIPAMRFMLETAVLHNWEEPYKIDGRTRDSYEYFLQCEYGISLETEKEEDSEWL